MSNETPLMKQFNQIKSKYPDAILLFRVGDFYETFGEDAIKTSQALGITLTKRSNGAAGEVPLAGIPYHALDNYLPRLVRHGYRVAICNQLEDPKMTKTIVKRGVTEIVSPGITTNDTLLDAKKNNFLASIYQGNKHIGIALLDMSTGEFYVAKGEETFIQKVLQSHTPSELIYPKGLERTKLNHLISNHYNYSLEDWVYGEDYSKETLLKKFKTTSLKGFGIDEFDESTIAASAILHYLNASEYKNLDHIRKISILLPEQFVWMDNFSIRNLELVQGQHPNAVTLFDVLNHTDCGMGARMLQRWIVLPLKNIDAINHRLNAVEKLVDDDNTRLALKEIVKQIGDLERLISKVALLKATPREIVQLKKSQKLMIPFVEILKQSKKPELTKFIDFINPLMHLVDTIETQLLDEPPAMLNKGCIFKTGFNEALDENLYLMKSGKDILLEIQQRESEKTQISSLKIGFNNVFGYYLEVTHTHKDKVPADWIRKQTLSNAERYITPELKEYEQKIMSAEEKMYQIQEDLWQKLILYLQDFIDPIQKNAKTIAEIDCLLSLATVATLFDYHKPEINDTLTIDIKEGRHPVIERQLPIGQTYVPNDILISNDENQIMLITGPNMSGKSAVLRQTALIVLMAQMGSFVPAKKATIGYIDKLFTRVGASDNLSMGESTFMVEMNETASIVNNISERSLILLDEIGRGTSTYDGISIAWSLVEYLYFSEKKPKTLFATHYHELNELGEKYDRIKNVHVSIKETEHAIIFLRKLIDGGSEHSFGIHVAKMAGMPHELIQRAESILSDLEKKSIEEDSTTNKVKKISKQASYQLNIFDTTDPVVLKLRDELKSLNTDSLSPMEALIKLHEWKNLL